MKKFVYLYSSPPMTEAPSDEVMALWTKWFDSLGDKLVDAGNPFGAGQAVHAGGVMPVEGKPATGYSIINANDMTEALELAKGSPMLQAPEGAVCVYEALPM